MRVHVELGIAVLLSACGGPPPRGGAARPVAAAEFSPTAILGWLRSPAHDFGCALERAGGPPESAYRCGAPAPATGDPCVETGPYYAGPSFPDALVARIGHGVTAISLEWEHGDLRQVTLVLSPAVGADEARAAFDLRPLPANVQSVDIQQCQRDRLCAVLVGFDHMGAGELECPG